MTDLIDVKRGHLLLLLPAGLRVEGKPESTIDEACRVVALNLYDEADLIDTGSSPEAIEEAYKQAIADATAFGAQCERTDDGLRITIGPSSRVVVPRRITFREGAWPKIPRIDWSIPQTYGLKTL